MAIFIIIEDSSILRRWSGRCFNSLIHYSLTFARLLALSVIVPPSYLTKGISLYCTHEISRGVITMYHSTILTKISRRPFCFQTHTISSALAANIKLPIIPTIPLLTNKPPFQLSPTRCVHIDIKPSNISAVHVIPKRKASSS